jgi:Uma2 family endonuclease
MDASTLPEIHDPDELLGLPDDRVFEFVNQSPVEMSMGAESEYIGALFVRWLGNHCIAHNLGWVFGGKTGYRCFPHDDKLVRIPDASFVAAGRFEEGRPPRQGFIRIPPDLAVEVLSPNDLAEEVEEKLADYRKAGVKLVWVVSPTAKTVMVRRPDGHCTLLDETGTLSGEDVLPGFTGNVADLFI